jgi:hypothetical protein
MYISLSRRLALSAVASVCLAVGAAPGALAKSNGTHYAGKTRDGDPISFTLVGSNVTQLHAYVPTVCGTPDPGGLPLSGSDPFDPRVRSRWRAPQRSRPSAPTRSGTQLT